MADSWETPSTWSPDKPMPTMQYNFTMPPAYSTIPGYYTMAVPEDSPTREPLNTQLLLTIGLVVRVVLFATCLTENSIAIYILHKSLKNGRKTFARHTLITVACSDILHAILYYPTEFVRFSHGEFVWFVQGQVGDFLCKLFAFLSQIPGKVLILCLIALACDVTRNLSRSKGRREHSRTFSVILMVFFWIFAAGLSSMYFDISKVQFKMCLFDSARGYTINLVNSVLFVVTADFILTILNLVIFCKVRRRKKEIKRKRKAKKAERMKVRQRRRNRIEDATKAKVQQLTEDIKEIQSSQSCQPDGEDFVVETSQETSRKPSLTVNELPTETEAVNDDSVSDNADVEEQQDSDESALEDNLDATRDEAKIEGATSLFFVILSITLLILPYVCKSQACSQYGLFAVQILMDFYGVIKPGIYAYTDKEFRKRYKQLSPFACCCFRRIQCHTVREQVETRNNRPTQEGSA